MSLFTSMHVDCPNCGHTNTMEGVGSVNADRRPDLRDEIMADTFQIEKCTECGTEFRLQPEFNYFDMENGLWILALPATQLEDHIAQEDRTTALFNASYGPNAAPDVQEVGTALTCRLTFGWPAVREKILARIEDLDDVVLEMMKLDLMRRLPQVYFNYGVELRLLAVNDGGFEMAWLLTDSEEVQEVVRVGRELYDAILDQRADWAEVEADLMCGGAFCDMQKLFLGAGRNAAE